MAAQPSTMLTLSVGDTEIKVDEKVLKKNAVFAAMLSSGMQESRGGPIVIRETKVEAFNILLTHLQTPLTALPSELEFADFLVEVKPKNAECDIQQSFAKYIKEITTKMSIVVATYELARRYQEDVLCTLCERSIGLFLREFKAYSRLSRDATLDKCLKDPLFKKAERFAVYAVIHDILRLYINVSSSGSPATRLCWIDYSHFRTHEALEVLVKSRDAAALRAATSARASTRDVAAASSSSGRPSSPGAVEAPAPKWHILLQLIYADAEYAHLMLPALATDKRFMLWMVESGLTYAVIDAIAWGAPMTSVAPAISALVVDGNVDTLKHCFELLKMSPDATEFLDERQGTLLHLACQSDQVDVVNLLLWLGADPTAFGATGLTPRSIARGRKNMKITALLDAAALRQALGGKSLANATTDKAAPGASTTAHGKEDQSS